MKPGSFIIWGTLVSVLGLNLFSPELAEPADQRPTKMTTILILGDSLTDGFGLTREEAYPALIGEKMRAAKYRGEVINAGSSGDTTGDALARLSSLLHRKRLDILILALGINDAFRGVPVEEMRANLQAIIDQTRERYPAVAIVIAGMRFPVATGNGYVEAFEGMYGRLAEQNQAELVTNLLEGVAANPALNQLDLIHPNAAGQRILAENVWRVLEPMLAKKARATD